MKVRLLVSMAGNDTTWNRGDEYECGADEARRLIEAGSAELIRADEPERAVAKPKRAEKAVK